MPENKESNNKEFNENDYMSLTPWGILSTILKEYNINCDHITNRMGVHIVDDFMNSMNEASKVVNEKIEEIKNNTSAN